MSKIRNPATLLHVLAHHGKKLEPLVLNLALLILVELEPLGWELEQVLTGPNSYKLVRNGKEFHFRSYGNLDEIEVKDAYQLGSTVFRIKTRTDVIRFGRMVIATP
jgi:hypothetical protein